MPTFQHDGLTFRYIDEGARSDPPVLLIHGFASNIEMNWIGPSWVKALVDASFRVLALDNRGHGQSDKPRDPEAYRPALMAADACALLDEVGLDESAWLGYSMGGRIAAFAALQHSNRVRCLILGGIGEGLVTGLDDADGIAAALLTDEPSTIEGDRPRMFRAFADKTGSDRHALAACIATSREVLAPQSVGAIVAPTLVAVGTKDDIAGSPEKLAALMPNATALAIPGRDHMLSVGDRKFIAETIAFLRTNTDG